MLNGKMPNVQMYNQLKEVANTFQLAPATSITIRPAISPS